MNHLGREADITKYGIRILRFTNNQIFNDINSVKNEILVAMAGTEEEAVSKVPPSFFTPKSPKGDLLINKDIWNPL